MNSEPVGNEFCSELERAMSEIEANQQRIEHARALRHGRRPTFY